MNLKKVGQKYRITNTKGGSLQSGVYTIELWREPYFVVAESKNSSTGCSQPNGSYDMSFYTFEEINPPTPMPQTDDIPKTLSIMERIKETPDRKTLIKAGYIAAGEYTQKAKDLAIILFLETQTSKLVELATEELAETKEE